MNSESKGNVLESMMGVRDANRRRGKRAKKSAIKEAASATVMKVNKKRRTRLVLNGPLSRALPNGEVQQ